MKALYDTVRPPGVTDERRIGQEKTANVPVSDIHCTYINLITLAPDVARKRVIRHPSINSIKSRIFE